jgi:hypothetical protein
MLGFQPDPHHAEVVFNPNPMNQKIMVTDFGYPRARFIKTLNENRLWLLPLQTLPLSNFFGLFSRFSGRDTLQTFLVKNDTFTKKSKKSKKIKL